MHLRFLFTCFVILSSTLAFSQSKTYNINDNEEYPLLESASDNPSLKNSQRHREFRINPVLQQADVIQKNDTILLDLFEDCKYTAYVTGISTNIAATTMINGCINDYKFSSFFISTSEGKSYIQIDIPEKEELYAANYIHDQGIYFLKQLDYVKNEKPSEVNTTLKNETPENNLQSKSISPNNLRVTDTQETITLLIAYTPEAVRWSNQNATDINNVLDMIMTKSQLVLDNSKTNVKLKLVCATEVDYAEEDLGKDFERLYYKDDGYMDEVHALRDFYYADLVLLLSGKIYWGGMGCLFNGFEDQIISVSDINLATYGYTAIHEIGHLLGCHHYKDHVENPPPNTYNYGWEWHDTKDDRYYCSVMTYGLSDFWPDGNGRARVPHFSNPDVQYNGINTGVANEADNARRIRDTKAIAAKFRVENCAKPSAPNVSITQPTICNGKGSVKLTNLPTNTWTLLRFPDNRIVIGTGPSATVSLDQGSYSYSVIDNNSKCPSSLTQKITIINTTPDAPVLEEIVQTSCTSPIGNVKINHLPDNGELIIHSKAGNTSVIYVTTPVYIDLWPGTYSFSVKNSMGCSSAKTDTIIIKKQPEIPDVPNIAEIKHPECNGLKGKLLFDNLPRKNWELYEVTKTKKILLESGINEYSILTLRPGSHEIFVKLKDGCSSFTTNGVINDPPPSPKEPVVDNITHPTCTNPLGSITISQLPENIGKLKIYNELGDSEINIDRDPLILDLGSGEYSFSAQNSYECYSRMTDKIVINDPPALLKAPNIEARQPGCYETIGYIKLTGMPSGSWEVFDYENTIELLTSGSSTNVSIPKGPGTYKFIVKDSHGCYSEETEETEISLLPTPPAPVAEVISQPTCYKETGMIHINNLSSDSWELLQYLPKKITLRSGEEDMAEVELPTGEYSFISKNEFGCESEESNHIRIDDQPVVAPPEVEISRHPSCTNPVGAISFSDLPEGTWSMTRIPDNKVFTGSGSDTTIDNIPAGRYSFNVTNSESCTSKNSKYIDLFQLSLIPKPTITQKGMTLISSPADSYQWYLSNEPIEGATKKDFTVVKEGEYHVVVNEDLCFSEPSDKIYITINGIGDINAGLNVYPNPADSELFLELPDNNELVQVEIFSVSGELFYSSEFTNLIHINVKQLPSGVYFIKSYNKKIRVANKFVKN